MTRWRTTHEALWLTELVSSCERAVRCVGDLHKAGTAGHHDIAHITPRFKLSRTNEHRSRLPYLVGVAVAAVLMVVLHGGLR